MNYLEAVSYRKELAKQKGMVLGLGTMRTLMEELGNPQDRLKFIHLAGTNGKGSTSSYLEQALIAAGYRTGKYTSPAVFDFREQYQVNGVWMEEEEAAACLTKVAEAAARMVETGQPQPTSFEQETALAFVWFAEKKCDLVVLETGLGGDEDATNVVKTTVCSVLTSISLDHRRILGGTLAEIASHKAGIIKPGIPVVSHPQSRDAMEVIRRRAEELHAPLFVSRPDAMVLEAEDANGMTVSYGSWNHLHTTQTALWQIENMAVALEVLEELKRQGYVFEESAVRTGWEQMTWHGRFEIISKNPLILLDGAHNPAGAAALSASLDHRFHDRRKTFVMGVLADKDYSKMIDILFSDRQVQTVYTVASDSARALPARELAAAIQRQQPGCCVQAAESVKQALTLAAREAGEDGMIVVCGSLSFMKEIKNWQDE
ncbi:MAG: bifunctional folylpolyglutamate synthase/dihydrofolate synthase [Lachnospiraceae bacterium]|nr:bifunctional folylpolyglutamate synthase/dihydrofolate synthase [Lachnospiraceae bacterium]